MTKNLILSVKSRNNSPTPHISKTGVDNNWADFVIDNSIVLELKVKPFTTKDDYYQILRYLEFLNLPLGIIVNFRQQYLKPKRIINNKLRQ